MTDMGTCNYPIFAGKTGKTICSSERDSPISVNVYRMEQSSEQVSKIVLYLGVLPRFSPGIPLVPAMSLTKERARFLQGEGGGGSGGPASSPD